MNETKEPPFFFRILLIKRKRICRYCGYFLEGTIPVIKSNIDGDLVLASNEIIYYSEKEND